MENTRDGSPDILVDPARYELDAAWVKEASAWARVLERILHGVRHQMAAIGVGAVMGLVWMVGARAQDTNILFAALGSIVAITVSAEFIDGKNSDQRRR